MQWSYSRVDTYQKCPFRYRCRYIEKLKPEKDLSATNPLILGTTVHEGIRKSAEEAIHDYYMTFPIIGDEHETEAMKIEKVVQLAKDRLPVGGAFEVEIKTPDFIGYIDYLLPIGGDVYDLYDFKYTAKFDRYRYSAQLHLYKYFFEKAFPRKKIRSLYYMLIPKVGIKQKNTENIIQYRQRVRKELSMVGVDVMKVEYDPNYVIKHLLGIKKAQEAKKFPAKENEFCFFCEYRSMCELQNKEENTMKLPENTRRKISDAPRRTLWIYGAPFSGKTTFCDGFPDPLMINTDGNIKYVTAPYIAIKDEIQTEGRITNRIYAWEIFKDTIAELEKKDNTFKTIIVDLLEDLYEHCRQYVYFKENITHESDDPFRAWDKVTTEFLTTIKRLMNLDYDNIILVSHEDTSKDFTRRSGDKITSIKPNIRDKVALKIAGMVDVVARIVSEDGKYTFNFKSDEVVFGGGRLKVDAKEIPLDVEELFEVYKAATEKAAKRTPNRSKGGDIPFLSEKAEKIAEEVDEELETESEEDKDVSEDDKNDVEEKPRRRARRVRSKEDD